MQLLWKSVYLRIFFFHTYFIFLYGYINLQALRKEKSEADIIKLYFAREIKELVKETKKYLYKLCFFFFFSSSFACIISTELINKKMRAYSIFKVIWSQFFFYLLTSHLFIFIIFVSTSKFFSLFFFFSFIMRIISVHMRSSDLIW